MNSREGRFAYRMLAPALGFLGITTLITLTYLVISSMYGQVRGEDAFVLLRNYALIIQDHEFTDGLTRSALYVVLAVSGELVVGMGIALLLRRQTRAAGTARSLIILPMMIAPIVAGLVWRILYDPSFGTLDYLLNTVGLPAPAWLDNSQLALPSLVIVDIWQWTPFVFLVLLAGLSALSDEPAEAARVDGANSWQVFRYVTLPSLMPLIDLLVLLRAVDAFKTFDTIYTLTQGGPGYATETAVYYDYLTGFRYFDSGRASAIAILLLLLIIVGANLYVRFRHVKLVEVTA
ncbi:MAG: carbohydrate ABC transporter permease [Candidatus Limnocylindrales bacterium]